MGKQVFSFKGMQRDMDPSKMSNQYAYEIRNMRIVAQDDSTLLSMVTEKGNEEYIITGDSVIGDIIGYCVCGQEYLVLFTHREINDVKEDRIYRLTIAGDLHLDSIQLYQGNLNFQENCVMETMFVYENSKIKKVYWIDGYNQPRFINVENLDAVSSYTDTSFDFVLPIEGKEAVSVTKLARAGLFNAGTIQYAISYYNKNGTSSKIVYISPIYYCSDYTTGNAPDRTVNCAFKIDIDGIDSSFDHLRIYSIFRSSRNGTPICKRVYDAVTVTKDSETLTRTSSYQNLPSVSYPLIKDFSLLKAFEDVPNQGSTSDERYFKDYIVAAESNKITYEVPYVICKNGPAVNNVQPVIIYRSGTMATVIPNLTVIKDVITNEVFIDELSSHRIQYATGEIVISAGNKRGVDKITFIDNNISGETVDYNEILYLGGYNIIPNTMDQKNNTLFLANYKSNDIDLNEELEKEIKRNCTVSFVHSNDYIVEKGENASSPAYINKYQLNYNSEIITTFKCGEIYKIGLMFQDKYGAWSRVIPVDTVKNVIYPEDRDSDFSPVKCQVNLSNNEGTITTLLGKGFIKVRTVVAPISEKEVLCQGVLCPTVFNPNKRKQNAPYAQPSWYFRSPMRENKHGVPKNYHYQNFYNYNWDIADFENQEIQGASHQGHWIGTQWEGKNNADYYPDWNIVTLNSPDLDSEETTYIPKEARMRIIGWLPIDKSWPSMKLQTSVIPYNIDGGLDPNYVSGTFYSGNCVDISSYTWKDQGYDSSDGTWTSNMFYFPVFPFHRSNSLAAYKPTQDPLYDKLEWKIKANLRESMTTYFCDYEDSLSYDISNTSIVYDDNVTRVIPNDSNDINWDNTRNYSGNIDVVVTPSPYRNVGYDPKNNIISTDHTQWILWNDTDQSGITYREFDDSTPVSMKYKSNTHSVFALDYTKNKKQIILPAVQFNGIKYGDMDNMKYGEPIWSSVPTRNPFDSARSVTLSLDYNTYKEYIYFYYAYVQNDSNWRLCVKISDDLLSGITFQPGVSIIVIRNCEDILLYNQQVVINNQLVRVTSGYDVGSTGSRYNLVFIYPNITWQEDQIVQCNYHLQRIYRNNFPSDPAYYENIAYVNPNEPYYKAHDKVRGAWFVALDNSGNNFWAYADEGDKYQNYYVYTYKHERIYNGYHTGTNTCITTASFGVGAPKKFFYTSQQTFNLDNLTTPLPGYKDGLFLAELYLPEINNDVIKDTDVTWTIGSTAQLLFDKANIEIPALNADCYFQRYDCLKTFSYTLEDKNQIVEIFSFMCETRTNIEGRYDGNRGKAENTDIYINNFNLINKGYTQENNFYSYSYLDYSYYNILEWTNGVLWTMNKIYGSDIDAWTNIIPSSVLHMDGAFGAISALRLVNDQLLCFQDKGLSLINYNERAVIANETGVPVEIANSGKVSGKTVLSSKVGCSNKESIIVTESGVYWADSNSRKLYLYGKEGLMSLSDVQGFETYFRDNNLNINTIKSFNDIVGKDVYFEIEHTDSIECLNFNEKLGSFTSFFDYNMKFLFNFKDDVITIRNNRLYKQFAGDYLNFFGEQKYYSVEFISNDNPTYDKIFIGLDFRADVLGYRNHIPGMLHDSDILDHDNSRLESSINEVPYTKLRVWDEYQDTGDTTLTSLIRRGTNLSQKFRIWRAEIGRDTLLDHNKLDRIRNPWVRIKLFNDNQKPLKVVTHDIIVNYV